MCNLNFNEMKNYLLLYFLMVSIAFGACTNDIVVSDNQDRSENEEIVKVGESMKIYSDLIDSFKKGKTRGTDEDIYPDYYGGGYIDDDGSLVIWVKEGFNIPTTLEEHSVIIKEGLYSYNELNKIMEIINTFKGSSLPSSVSANIYMWVLDERNNRIEVYLKNCTDADIDEFKRAVINSPAIVFKAKEGISESWDSIEITYEDILMTRAVINVCAGTKIYAAAQGSTTAKPGSFGYKAKRNGVEGFVTAGHVAAKDDVISRPADGGTSVNIIGKCNVSEHKNNGNLDAAFCVLTSSSFALTNQIGNTGKTYSQYLYRNYAVGTPVSLCGGNTSSTGKITTLKISVEDEKTGVVINDMVGADYASIGGDSGGLVYMSINANNYVLGVHHSGTHSGSTHVTTFCPATRIQDDMGIIPSV